MNTHSAIILSLLAVALVASAAPWSRKVYLRIRPSDELRQVPISKDDRVADVKAKIVKAGMVGFEASRTLLVQEDRLLRDEEPVSSIERSPVDLFDCALEDLGRHIDWAFNTTPLDPQQSVHAVNINYLPSRSIYGVTFPNNTIGYVRRDIEAKMAANNKAGRPLFISYDGSVQDDDSQALPAQLQLVFCKNL